MPVKGWKNLSIKEDTFNEIQVTVENEKAKIPYTTITEFVDSAIKEKLARIKAEQEA